MADIIPFNNSEEQEPHTCESCDLVYEYMIMAKLTESEEDLYQVLSELVQEAKDLGLKEYLYSEINAKAELLDYLESNCCEEE